MAGITPIICVGETEAERNQQKTVQVVRKQLQAGLDLLQSQIDQCIIAYEPVWAIGTGLTATPEQAEEAHQVIRKFLWDRFGMDASARTSILYGGSVKAANAAELFAQPDIDGGLIGGASLVAQEFMAICRAAAGPQSRS